MRHLIIGKLYTRYLHNQLKWWLFFQARSQKDIYMVPYYTNKYNLGIPVWNKTIKTPIQIAEYQFWYTVPSRAKWELERACGAFDTRKGRYIVMLSRSGGDFIDMARINTSLFLLLATNNPITIDYLNNQLKIKTVIGIGFIFTMQNWIGRENVKYKYDLSY